LGDQCQGRDEARAPRRFTTTSSSTGKPSNIAGTLEHKKGDVEAGFKEADVIVERSFETEAVHQGYIEPHACLVSVVDGKATIWSSSQGQFMVRAMSALLTGMQQSDIRAIPAEIGGGFGGKTIVYLEPAGAGSGQEVGPAGQDGDVARGGVPRLRPDLGLDEQGQDRRQEGRHDRRRPGHLLAAGRRLPGLADPRRRGCAFGPTTSRTPYTLGYDVVSNRSKVAAYRAPGAPIGAYAVECVLDELAEKLGMDPLELRSRTRPSRAPRRCTVRSIRSWATRRR
jgi:CO/xanthine dehydrogenase Mo-binding subunit